MRIPERKTLYYFFTLILVVAPFEGCRQVPKDIRNVTSQNEVLSAERLSIEKRDGYTLIKIYNPWQGQHNVVMEYALVRAGSDIPAGIDSTKVIFIPVRKVVCMSVTHAAMMEAIGCEDFICGISGKNLVWSPVIRNRIEKNKIPDVGYDTGINTELILKLSPDLLIMYGIGSESAGYVNKLRDAGVKIIYDADYLENSPLGKAEWIRLFGALFCRDEAADSIFRTETELYKRESELIREKTMTRPLVLLGLPYHDTWYISPGNSYISRLISDAGGRYLWEEAQSERSMPQGIENVYMRAIKADFWLNPGIASSKRDIASIDIRLTDLPCYIKGNVFNNTRRMNASGGNDYWETGSVHPAMLLQDISRILHPELYSDTSLVFYKKLQ